MAETYDFPDDLRAAQLDLHRTRAEYAALCRTLPWSVTPEPGWTGEKHVLGDRVVSFPDSPGYTAEQAAEVKRLRRRLLDLSVTVSTHPYWATLSVGVVDARTALKHAHEQSAPEQAAHERAEGKAA
ncbi:hypothetical protein [Streptomyces sp. NBC_00829]|uniref:hypothetical protein n=1 Tax=Streptomyces sp. NBC_00829 TaxID=2903679 RepID=UPI003868BE4E|nr:hypothetical protein OG293_16795 [Streptomyces sp. NBC_00829]